MWHITALHLTTYDISVLVPARNACHLARVDGACCDAIRCCHLTVAPQGVCELFWVVIVGMESLSLCESWKWVLCERVDVICTLFRHIGGSQCLLSQDLVLPLTIVALSRCL
jgi:hypothetical protein